MHSDSLHQMISRFAPFLLILSLILVTSGAAILLYFGYAVYQLLVTPEQSVFMNYILSNVPYPLGDTYMMSGTYDNREFTIAFPTDVFSYARYGMAFVLWLIAGAIVGQLIGGGMSIFKVLNSVKSKQEDSHYGSTRNSDNTR